MFGSADPVPDPVPWFVRVSVACVAGTFAVQSSDMLLASFLALKLK